MNSLQDTVNTYACPCTCMTCRPFLYQHAIGIGCMHAGSRGSNTCSKMTKCSCGNSVISPQVMLIGPKSGCTTFFPNC